MQLPFAQEEYDLRLKRVRERMSAAGLEALIVTDIPNQHYLTGYDGWSFYTPQIVALTLEGPPTWIGRAMDAAGGKLTAWMPKEHVVGYPESTVQRLDIHPMDWTADYLKGKGYDGKRIGCEVDSYYFSPRAMDRLKAGLPNARFVDADLLVNWVRTVKSPQELAYMREAGKLVGKVMRTAMDAIRPGVRQCDAVAKIYAAQVGGHERYAGDITSLCPLILSGEGSSAPHMFWTEERFARDQTTSLEMSAAIRHYHCSLARTMHVGKSPQRLLDTAKAVIEGMQAVLDTVREGAIAEDVEAAWRAVINRHGLKKESRIGYAIGLGYPPDWGERTVSLRPGDKTALQADMTLHVILGMWMDGWGIEVSETMRVLPKGVELFTDFPRDVLVIE